MAMFALMNVVLVQEYSREGIRLVYCLLRFPDKFWSQCHEIVFLTPPAEDYLTNNAGWVLLQNYRGKGIVYHLVTLADKYQKSASLGLALGSYELTYIFDGLACTSAQVSRRWQVLTEHRARGWACDTAILVKSWLDLSHESGVNEHGCMAWRRLLVVLLFYQDEEEPEFNLDGLFERLANDEVVRARLLKDGTLFGWPDEKTVSEPKTIYVPHAREEVNKLRNHLSMPDNPVRVNCDAVIACLRTLYELVTKYWAPKQKASSESLESDDCEVINGVSECPLEDGYEEVEGEELLVAEQLGVVPASSDVADLSPALKSGLTDDLSKLSLESPHVSVKRPAPSSSSKAPAKRPKREIFEISDSPCATKTSGRPPVDPARLARVEFLKHAIQKRSATKAVARPLQSNSLPSVDDVDTCPANLSPIAKNLENRFALVARGDDEMATEKVPKVPEEKPALVALDGDESQKVPKEEPALVAVDGDESQKVPKEEPALVATAMAFDENKQVPSEEPAAAIPTKAERPPVARREDDVFFDDTALSRNEQIAARDALKQCGGEVKPAAALKAAICKDPEQEEAPAPKRKPGRPKKGAKAPAEDELESKEPAAAHAVDAKDDPAQAEDAPAETPETPAEPNKKKRRVKGEDGQKKTFASRPMPKVDVFAIQRFKAIREAYELLIAPKLRFRSSLEEYGLKTVQNDRFWGHTMESLSGLSDATKLKRICNAFIQIMVLLASMDVARPCEHFEVVEMFAGSARVSRLAKGLGKHAVALDKSIDGSMDLNTDAGFLFMLLVLLMVALEIVPVIESYPPRFAGKLLRMQKDLLDRRPILPEEVTHHRKTDTLIDLLKRLPEDECNDAELYSALKEEISSAEGPVADAVLESINDDEYKFLMQTLKVKAEVKKEPEVEAEGLAPAVAPETLLEEPLQDTLVNTPSPAKAPKSMPFDFAPPTQAAINARLRRIFKARANGDYQVDAEFLKMYKDKNAGGQAKIYKLFERTGFNPVTFVKHCKKVTQELSEEIRKAGIKRYCQKFPKSKRTLVEKAMEFEEDTDNEMDAPDRACSWGMLQNDGFSKAIRSHTAQQPK
ncbi:unnamed protein product [Symbiodinium sp. CCMP2592]|nr:unnamed protein product [Symbiodinium sp. CCMP2592]